MAWYDLIQISWGYLGYTLLCGPLKEMEKKTIGKIVANVKRNLESNKAYQK